MPCVTALQAGPASICSLPDLELVLVAPQILREHGVKVLTVREILAYNVETNMNCGSARMNGKTCIVTGANSGIGAKTGSREPQAWYMRGHFQELDLSAWMRLPPPLFTLTPPPTSTPWPAAVMAP